MDKIHYLISEGFKNIWRHKMTAFTAVFSLFLALFFVGLMATAGENTHKILQYLRAKYKIEVFFDQDVANEKALGLIHQIKKINGVRTVTLIEKEDAMRIFKDQFGEDILEILGYNPLPVSAVINLVRASKFPVKADPIVNKIKTMKGVAEVRYQGSLIRKIERTYYRILGKLPVIAGIVVLVAVLVIYNTVKLSVYSRRQLILTLEMIGATRTFIKMPFIFEGFFIAILSSSIAFPVLVGTIETGNYILANFTSWGIRLSFDPVIWIWLFVLSATITILGSYRAIEGILK
ncbi:MAG: permease-like cell division protein FtsX [Candidatus Neomarinimicrobiota bacterium]|nr:permease-like cell division protein FtsX [Candidatus Neomarinimicrobiota bacterium]